MGDVGMWFVPHAGWSLQVRISFPDLDRFPYVGLGQQILYQHCSKSTLFHLLFNK